MQTSPMSGRKSGMMSKGDRRYISPIIGVRYSHIADRHSAILAWCPANPSVLFGSCASAAAATLAAESVPAKPSGCNGSRC